MPETILCSIHIPDSLLDIFVYIGGEFFTEQGTYNICVMDKLLI